MLKANRSEDFARTRCRRGDNRVRRFPSVLQPADVSVLSFEIAGQLKAINLQAGQKVQLGDLLAETDPRSLQAQVEQASAGVQQADAQSANAEADFQRKEELIKKGATTQATFDQSKATALSAQAQLEQARRQLALANHNLDRSKLLAPFSGTIARVEVKSFSQVPPDSRSLRCTPTTVSKYLSWCRRLPCKASTPGSAST